MECPPPQLPLPASRMGYSLRPCISSRTRCASRQLSRMARSSIAQGSSTRTSDATSRLSGSKPLAGRCSRSIRANSPWARNSSCPSSRMERSGWLKRVSRKFRSREASSFTAWTGNSPAGTARFANYRLSWRGGRRPRHRHPRQRVHGDGTSFRLYPGS